LDVKREVSFLSVAVLNVFEKFVPGGVGNRSKIAKTFSPAPELLIKDVYD